VRALADIPVSDVIAAVDGPIALTACVDGSVTECESRSLCPMQGRWGPVNDAIQQALGGITLADMQDAAIPPPFRLPARASQPPGQALVQPPGQPPGQPVSRPLTAAE
jgi:DNA-binding IscR family transcriptional regulator